MVIDIILVIKVVIIQAARVQEVIIVIVKVVIVQKMFRVKRKK